jgi:hypothetical protein
VLTEYEKQERRNQKAWEKRAKKAAEKQAEVSESEGDGRKRGARGRGTQPKR